MNKNTFYKYKSLSNFEFVLDILLRERLYASKYGELNDPMEGVIKVDGTIPDELEETWKKILEELRVCCFTPDDSNTLMWAHYADGGRGCVIEFELLQNSEPVKVCYRDKPKVSKNQLTKDKAIEILKYKDSSWKYEKEFRCITSDTYVPITVKKLILGPKVQASTVELLQGILRCCKPELQVVQIKGRGDSVVERVQMTISSKRVYYSESEECSKCLELEHYREQLVRL
ncbi:MULTISPECIES: DUF2971 domain-containing protein [Vibrio]|nr:MULTISPECIES: DUF2971 domain-containing protein [Vibrio]MCX9582790.1 DUF2971 domain-containing protein [Vibrio cholerae]MCX9586272.1 DUF2971 domain-containing protein [Vibrio cholerae]MEB5598774.1 DUF2971 domain-containing protein [Vibrio cholerae]ORP25921.1 hypothetical protein B7953_02250 [Vibrio paracholerae]RBM42998.1 DUF2971 domain-containing protein [Vibrio paracholerae]